MKHNKFFISVIFIFLNYFFYSETFTVMSFNIQGASGQHRANNTEWVNDIAEIIKMSNADIVLLQETPILSDSDIKGEFIRVLKDSLKEKQSLKKWSGISTFNYLRNDYNNKKPPFTLNNAVLYNSEVFMTLGNGRYPINFQDSKLFINYKSYFNNFQVIQFAFKNNMSKKFLIMNIHTYYQDPKFDLEKMGNIINAYCNNQSFIIAGDFNMSIRMVYETIRNYGNKKIYIDGNTNPIDDTGLKTTISTKCKNNELFLANDYDHFLYSGKIKNIGVIHHVFSNIQLSSYPKNYIKVGEKNYNNKTRNFRSEISDHLPVVMTFEYK